MSHLVFFKVSLPLLRRQVRQAHRFKDFSLGAAGNMTIRRVKAIPIHSKSPALSPGGGNALFGLGATSLHSQGNRPALSVSGEDIDGDAAWDVHHQLFLGAICPTYIHNTGHHQVSCVFAK